MIKRLDFPTQVMPQTALLFVMSLYKQELIIKGVSKASAASYLEQQSSTQLYKDTVLDPRFPCESSCLPGGTKNLGCTLGL